MSEYIIGLPDYVPPFDPAARAVSLGDEVVRCVDCRHYYECEEYSPHGNYVRRCCEYFDSYSDDVTPDGFCAWGERRDA